MTAGILGQAFLEIQEWDLTEAIFRQIENQSEQGSLLAILAGSLAEAQEWEYAERWPILSKMPLVKQLRYGISQIEDGNQKAWALLLLAETLFSKDRWQQASEVARSIGKSGASSERLHSLVLSLCRRKRLQWAEAIASSIENRHDRDLALQMVSFASAKSQRWEAAEIYASSIEDNSLRASTFHHLKQMLF